MINDSSPATAHAAKFVFKLAQQQDAEIIIANTKTNKSKTIGHLSLNYSYDERVQKEELSFMADDGSCSNVYHAGLLRQINEIDISDTDECVLAEFIKHNNVWMVVKGINVNSAQEQAGWSPKVHIVLNKISCPLLLIPEHWPVKTLERIMHISDLRYCEIGIIRYLAGLAKLSGADLSFAHLTAKGLPDMSEEYALNLFTDGICDKVKYEKLFFNKVEEKNVTAAIDVMVNGMKSDMLTFVNHHFHIEEILGDCEPKSGSASISVPVLIFPLNSVS